MTQFDVAEGIARGHPDKVADQISDAVVDACLLSDPLSRIAIETMVSHDKVAIGGECTTSAHLNFDNIVQSVFSRVGYTDDSFNPRIVLSISRQSADIAQSVGDRNGITSVTAGDQGTMIGYACNETPSYMPKAHEIARTLVKRIETFRSLHPNNVLGPDGKTQVAIDLTTGEKNSCIVSWQHKESASLDDVRSILTPIITEVSSQFDFHPSTVLINPSGRFVLGGPAADTGLTGRKQIADSYGSSVRHGGGAYSGKDATKVDRSGAYMARYVAKHVVAAQLASRCEIQLVYSIGRAHPLSVGIFCFGTEKVPLPILEQAIFSVFDFSVGGIISELQLCAPIYSMTSYGGHFGREEFSWEKVPHIEDLRRQCRI